MKLPFHLVLLLVCCTWACQPTSSTEPEGELARGSYQEPVNWVDTARAQQGTFQRELLSNGKLRAGRRAELSFQLDGMIAALPHRSGQRVRKGQLIARLEDEPQRQAVDQAEARLAQAELDRRDALLSAGHLQPDSAAVPSEAWDLASLQSGYRQAALELEAARFQLSLTRLYAPFSGVLADLEAQPYQRSSDYRPLCLLLDTSPLTVEFTVLETELNMVQKGAEMQVEPLSLPGQSFSARLTEVNPRVDENGLLRLRATVSGGDGQLLPGMNVRVRLRQDVPDQLMVPKEAVVLRQGRPVVFVYQRDTAYWHYVTPGLENSDTYAIEEGLEPGQTVITQGNLNLAHLAPVKVE